MTQDTTQQQRDRELLARIQNYLELGGCFNPELAEHDKVRDLIIDCRSALDHLLSENAKLQATLERLSPKHSLALHVQDQQIQQSEGERELALIEKQVALDELSRLKARCEAADALMKELEIYDPQFLKGFRAASQRKEEG